MLRNTIGAVLIRTGLPWPVRLAIVSTAILGFLSALPGCAPVQHASPPQTVASIQLPVGVDEGSADAEFYRRCIRNMGGGTPDRCYAMLVQQHVYYSECAEQQNYERAHRPIPQQMELETGSER